MTEFSGTDRFIHRRCLGRGSFGSVHEVFDRERQREVALKLPHESAARSLFLFKHEFRALADISHPNLISLHELFSDGNQWFFTMELVDGVDILRALRHRPVTGEAAAAVAPEPESPQSTSTSSGDELLPGAPLEEDDLPPVSAPPDLKRVAGIFKQLAHGLMAIHQAGLLHQDIKPSNVLVTAADRVVLLDFGLSSEFDPAEATPREALALTGTPAYMAPEQLFDHRCTEASDWYGVGVLLYHVLTGRLPFRGNGLRALVNKVTHAPAAPRRLIASIPEGLSELCMRLLDPHPENRPTGTEFLRDLAQSDGTTAPPNLRPANAPFVGRIEELTVLFQALQALREGHPGWINLHGGSGMGKSFLLRRFRREVHREVPEALVLSNRCYEQEDVPYKALDGVVDALSHHLQRLPQSELEAILPRHIHALAQVFPVLQQVPRIAQGGRRNSVAIDPQTLRHRAFSALRDLLRKIGDSQPLILIIDDLQWGDADSATLLADLLDPPDSPLMFLIACYRTEESTTSPVLRELLNLGRSDPGRCKEISLGALSAEDARLLAQNLLDPQTDNPSEMAEWIAGESGGNPFFIQELARRSGDATPRSRDLRGHILDRAQDLPKGAQELLGMVCLAGYPLEWRLLREAAYLAGGGNEFLDLLRQDHFIRIRKSGNFRMVEPYHDFIRQSVSSSLPLDWTRQAHLRIAEILETRSNPDVQALATHYTAAGESGKAISYLTMAGHQAAASLAFGRAASLFRLSLELRSQADPESPRIWGDLGDALTNAGRSREAAEAYLQAVPGDSPSAASRFQRLAALEFLRSGHYEKGLEALQSVLTAVGTSLTRTRLQSLVSAMLHRIAIRIRGLHFKERPASEIPQSTLDRLDAFWVATVGLATGDIMRVADFQARHLLLSLRTGEPTRLVRALTYEALCTSALGVRHEAVAWRHLRPAFVLAERLGDPNSMSQVLISAGITFTAMGKWRKGAEVLDRAETLFQDTPTGLAYELRNARIYSLMNHYVLGDLRVLAERLPALVREAEETGDLLFLANLRAGPAFMHHLACDDPEGARRGLCQIMDRLPPEGFLYQRHLELAARSNIDLYLGKVVEAWKWLNAQWQPLERSRMRLVQAIRITDLELRARIALAMAAKTPDAAERCRLLLLASKDTRKLSKEGVEYSMALVYRLNTVVAWLHGEREAAVGSALLSETAFASSDMALHANVMRRCRGLLKGGPGHDLVRESEAWMRRQGIVNPERMMQMFLPGMNPGKEPLAGLDGGGGGS